jgi:hypothetical protein
MVGCIYIWAQILKKKETMHVKNLLALL